MELTERYAVLVRMRLNVVDGFIEFGWIVAQEKLAERVAFS
jgi:hypothetical protein